MGATVIEMNPDAHASVGSTAGRLGVHYNRLAPPRRLPASVSRDRHRAVWADLGARPACLVRAPAGYGKSTFLAEAFNALSGHGTPVAWLSCDGDVTAASLRKILAGLSPHAAVPATAASIAGEACDDAYLFLDDIDRLADPAALDLLDTVMQSDASGLHLVAACRADPPALFDALDLQDGVLHIGVDVLALTASEAERFRPEIPRDVLAVRHAALGGWAKGLRTGSGGMSAERRVAAALDPTDRLLLAQCSVAGEIDGDRLVAVDRDRLEALASQGHFVMRSARGYRLLPPIRAALLPTLDAQARCTLHREAAHDCSVREDHARAIDHAIHAGDTAQAAAMLGDTAMGMIRRGDIMAVRALAARLPESTITPEAAGWLALLTHQGDIPGDPIASALSEDPTSARLAEARRLLDAGETFGVAMLRTHLAGAALAAGDCDAAHALLRPLQAGRTDPLVAARTALVTGACYRAQGQPAEAERVLAVADRAIGWNAASGSTASALVAVGLARARYERDDVAGAMALIGDHAATIETTGCEESLLALQTVRVRSAADCGDIAGAAALIERVEGIAFRRGWLRAQALCIVDRSRLGLPRTIAPDALLPVDREDAAVARPGCVDARIFAILAEARIYEAMDAGDRPRLNLISERLGRLAAATGDAETAVRATLYSILPQLSGRCNRMIDLTAIRELNRGAHNGFRRTIIDILAVNGVRVSAELGNANFAPSSFLALLAEVRPAHPDVVVTVHDHVRHDALSFLTGREIEILSALASGVSNKEMARLLKLTPETVKWHLKNIMRKLGAENRVEAVAHAETLGLDLTAG